MIRWISLVVRDAIRKYSHLVDSTSSFIDRMSELRVAENDVFMHMDLKDFFMTGSAQYLVHHCSLIIPFRFREVFREALLFILENQYISAHLFPKQLWRVVVGSGMGLKCSSDVSDAAFLHAVELCGLSLLSQASRQRFGIISYTCYRDNLLFVCKPDFERIRSLKFHIENHILLYKGQVEEASHIGVTFLDLNLAKDEPCRRTGTISYNPFLKSTSLLQVLSTRSTHLLTTHFAWMKAYICRLRRNSSCLTWFRTMKWQCLHRMRNAGIDHAIMTEVERASRFTFPIESACLQRSCSVPSIPKRTCCNTNTFLQVQTYF